MKDKEIREHTKKISHVIKNYTEEEVYTFFPDSSSMIGGPGIKAVKEKAYKSVEDYEKRIEEEILNKV